jgi:hypothetical protein
MNLRKVLILNYNIKDENGNPLADSQCFLKRWKTFSNQVLNVRGVHDVRQTAEPLVPDPSLVEVEITIGKLESYKSPGTDQNSTELIKAGSETLRSEIHKLVCSRWNKEELPQQRKESIIVPIHKNGDKTDCNNYRGIPLLSTAYKILSTILLARITHMSMKLLGIISGGSVEKDLLWIRFTTFARL